MFPIPTKGETMPPNEKQTAPNNAEAVPALSRIANAVDVVNVIPIIKRTVSNRSS